MASKGPIRFLPLAASAVVGVLALAGCNSKGLPTGTTPRTTAISTDSIGVATDSFDAGSAADAASATDSATPAPTATTPPPAMPNVFRRTVGKGYLTNWLFHPEGVAADGAAVVVADGNRRTDALGAHGTLLRFPFDGLTPTLYDGTTGANRLDPEVYGVATDGLTLYALTRQGVFGYHRDTGAVLGQGQPLVTGSVHAMALATGVAYLAFPDRVLAYDLPALTPRAGLPVVPGPATALATDASGKLYVAASGKVTVYNGGTPGLTFDGKGSDGGGPGFADLVGVAVDPRNGDVYAADAGSVLRFDAAGKYLTQFGQGHLAHPTGIAVGTDGYIYVSDDGTGEVDQFGPGF